MKFTIENWDVLYARKGAKRPKFIDGRAVLSTIIGTGQREVLLFDQSTKNKVEQVMLRKSEVFEQGKDVLLDRHIVQVMGRYSRSKAAVKTENSPEKPTESNAPAQKISPSFCFNKRKLPGSEEAKPAKKARLEPAHGDVRGFAANPTRSNVEAADKDDNWVKVSPLGVTSASGGVKRTFGNVRLSSNASGYRSAFKPPEMKKEPEVKFVLGATRGPRHVLIPDRFQDVSAYKTKLTEAVLEEISMALSEVATRLRTARSKSLNQKEATFEQLEKAFEGSSLSISRVFSVVKKRAGSFTLNLSNGSKHSMTDLWILSRDLSFENAFVGTALSYGSSVLEFRLFGNANALGEINYALHGPSVMSEVQMLDCLRKLETSSTPLMRLLLGRSPSLPTERRWNETYARNEVVAAINKYKLNDDQAQALFTVGKWLAFENAPVVPEICLVHGPFGSGKSHLMVVLIIVLSHILNERGDTSTRFVVCASTNAAVDRILNGLLQQGFTDFLRVGSLRKIDTNILPFSVHAASKVGAEEAEARRDLEELREDSVGGYAKQKIERELQHLSDGKAHQRKEMLKNVRVVGVTACSAGNAVLEDAKFKICFLDECSQMVEPQSLIPLCQFSIEKLVAVGDPQQLPPVLAKPHESMSCETLARTLFARLVALGHEPVLLRTQYRCHPDLAKLPNRLFYRGKLEDGCSESDRRALLPRLNPLVFIDTKNNVREMKDVNKSYSNLFEAEIVCTLIKAFVSGGISTSRIGVIVLYKAQATLIRQMLFPEDETGTSKRHERRFERVQVSTVDAFQGSEKDVIILSCSRTDGIGFSASPNRLNVAITRARHHLIVVGDASNLGGHQLWRDLVFQAKTTPNSFMTVKDMQAYIKDLDEDGTDLEMIQVREIVSEELLSGTAEAQVSEPLEMFLESVNFSPRDFWEGYKLYYIGAYSHSEEHRALFSQTLMGRAVRETRGELKWGVKLNNTMRDCWFIMEEYVKQKHGVDCGDTRSLIQLYDDPEVLAQSEYGRRLLDLCEDELAGCVRPPIATVVRGVNGNDFEGTSSDMVVRVPEVQSIEPPVVPQDDWTADLLDEDWTVASFDLGS